METTGGLTTTFKTRSYKINFKTRLHKTHYYWILSKYNHLLWGWQWGGSLHDARLGFFGLSRARHGVHGLHGFCEHKNTLRTIQCLWLGVLSFKHKRCAMRRKITKPRECEKNNKCSSGSCSQWNCFVSFSISGGSRGAKPPGKLTKITELRECELITVVVDHAAS